MALRKISHINSLTVYPQTIKPTEKPARKKKKVDKEAYPELAAAEAGGDEDDSPFKQKLKYVDYLSYKVRLLIFTKLAKQFILIVLCTLLCNVQKLYIFKQGLN